MNTDYIKGILASILILAFVAMCIYCCIDTFGKTKYDDTSAFIVRCNEIYGANNWTVEELDLKTEINFSTNTYYNHDHTKEVTITISYDYLTSQPIIATYDRCFFCEPNITRYTCFSRY